jgi:hypothetical protein
LPFAFGASQTQRSRAMLLGLIAVVSALAGPPAAAPLGVMRRAPPG